MLQRKKFRHLNVIFFCQYPKVCCSYSRWSRAFFKSPPSLDLSSSKQQKQKPDLQCNIFSHAKSVFLREGLADFSKKKLNDILQILQLHSLMGRVEGTKLADHFCIMKIPQCSTGSPVLQSIQNPTKKCSSWSNHWACRWSVKITKCYRAEEPHGAT